MARFGVVKRSNNGNAPCDDIFGFKRAKESAAGSGTGLQIGLASLRCALQGSRYDVFAAQIVSWSVGAVK